SERKLVSGSEVRSRFLRYFTEHDHRLVPSYPLVPSDDPTLLFTNAGMVQFKDVFTGQRRVDYSRAASSQKCLRVSGKHNDLENVGRTPRHHTFFEMLGNFSFGDYFKEGAIRYAWELMTEGYGLPSERLLVTIFRDDDEAYALWRTLIGVPAGRIVRHGEKDNFWAMGETGPCGPCSEIHWDRGKAYGPDPDDRYTELWNLVFMQYERTADGALHPLPRPSIDTGAGLERITAVLQGVESNYDTDLLRGIIARMEQLSGKRYGADPEADTSMRVIADHARATAFLIAEGVFPENEGRGYVLRRIMRRAIRHGTLLGLTDLFFHEACLAVIGLFGEHYRELQQGRPAIERMVQQEEEQFRRTLGRGLELISGWQGSPAGGALMPGELAFRLYDTYGFPLDLTEVIGQERGFSVDRPGFEQAMEAQRARGRASWKGAACSREECYARLAERIGEVRFLGYETEQQAGEPVLALLGTGREVERAAAPEVVELFVGATPFYGEAGGQAGDTGRIAGTGFVCEVLE
ncbi:MAG: alanine--tRNA ligase, partial [Deltaproteobacteria bacterium]|nr:alanine--tRNA ligase [Deltaproteobacteria bacterium]